MKRFFALCMVLSMTTPFMGCDKKAEVKKTTTVTTPEGSTTKTDSTKVETSGQDAHRQLSSRARAMQHDVPRPTGRGTFISEPKRSPIADRRSGEVIRFDFMPAQSCLDGIKELPVPRAWRAHIAHQ